MILSCLTFQLLPARKPLTGLALKPFFGLLLKPFFGFAWKPRATAYLPHLRALIAKLAFFFMAGDPDFFRRCNVDIGMFLPFLVLVAARSDPCLDFLILIGALP